MIELGSTPNAAVAALEAEASVVVAQLNMILLRCWECWRGDAVFCLRYYANVNWGLF